MIMADKVSDPEYSQAQTGSSTHRCTQNILLLFWIHTVFWRLECCNPSAQPPVNVRIMDDAFQPTQFSDVLAR